MEIENNEILNDDNTKIPSTFNSKSVTRSNIENTLFINGLTENEFQVPVDPKKKILTTVSIKAPTPLRYSSDLKSLIDSVGSMYLHDEIAFNEPTKWIRIEHLINVMDNKTNAANIRDDRFDNISEILFIASNIDVKIECEDQREQLENRKNQKVISAYYSRKLVNYELKGVKNIDGTEIDYIRFKEIPPTFEYSHQIDQYSTYLLPRIDASKIILPNEEKAQKIKVTPLRRIINTYIITKILPQMRQKNRTSPLEIKYETISKWIEQTEGEKKQVRNISNALEHMLKKYTAQGDISGYEIAIKNGAKKYYKFRVYPPVGNKKKEKKRKKKDG